MSWIKFPTSTGLWLWTEFDRTKKVWSDPEPVHVRELGHNPDRAWVERLGYDYDPDLAVHPAPNERWAPLNCPPPPPPEAEHQSIFEVTYEKHTVHRITYTLPAVTKEEAMARASDQHKKGNVPWRACGSSEALMYARLKPGYS